MVIMSSLLHIMHYPCFHYYIVITHYYHYCPLLHVTNGATCRWGGRAIGVEVPPLGAQPAALLQASEAVGTEIRLGWPLVGRVRGLQHLLRLRRHARAEVPVGGSLVCLFPARALQPQSDGWKNHSTYCARRFLTSYRPVMHTCSHFGARVRRHHMIHETACSAGSPLLYSTGRQWLLCCLLFLVPAAPNSTAPLAMAAIFITLYDTLVTWQRGGWG